jgi:urea transporter
VALISRIVKVQVAGVADAIKVTNPNTGLAVLINILMGSPGQTTSVREYEVGLPVAVAW